ncbi:MAG: hypothetical protein QXI19_02715 [Candidatus Caldarchaeum sp.]
MFRDVAGWLAQNAALDVMSVVPGLSWLTSGPLHVTQMASIYAANHEKPIIVPSPGELLRLLYILQAGEPVGNVHQCFTYNGIDIHRGIWRGVVEANRPRPPVALCYRGKWVAAETGDVAYQQASEQHLKYWGHRDQEWALWWKAIAIPFTPVEIADFYMRNLVDRADLVNTYQDLVLPHRGKWFNAAVWSRAVMPGPSDLIRFMVRDAFNENVVAKYSYDEEYPQEIERWLRAQGMNYLVNEHPAGAGAPPLHWGRFYWRAHWDLPSPTQAYEMLRRLRPAAAPRVAAELGVPPASIVTTIDEVRDLLKIADYPRFWRDRLIAISYLPINRTDLRSIITEGVKDPVPPEERLQDLGYTAKDAQVVADLFRKRALLTLANRGFLLSIREMQTKFANLEVTREELFRSLQMLGIEGERAEMLVAAADMRRRHAQRRFVIRQLTRAYVRAIISREELAARLRQLNLDGETIQLLLARADLQRTSSRKRITASGILWDFQRGLLLLGGALEMLEEIGYTRADAIRMLRRAAILRQEQILKQLQAYYRALQAEMRRYFADRARREREIRRLMRELQMTREQAEREYERQLKEAEREARERRRQLEAEAKAQAPDVDEAGAGAGAGADEGEDESEDEGERT